MKTNKLVNKSKQRVYAKNNLSIKETLDSYKDQISTLYNNVKTQRMNEVTIHDYVAKIEQIRLSLFKMKNSLKFKDYTNEILKLISFASKTIKNLNKIHFVSKDFLKD